MHRSSPRRAARRWPDAIRAGLAWALLACCMPAAAQSKAPDDFRDKLLQMGTGPDDGSFSAVGNALCEMLNGHRKTTLVRCVTVRSAGSMFNIHAVANGSLQWGIAQEDLVSEVFKDLSHTEGRGLRVVALLHESPISITVRKGSGITGLDQIRQGVVNLGYPGSGLAANMDLLLAALQLSATDLASVTRLPSGLSVQAFCAGNVDVILNASAHPTAEIRKLRDCGGEFLQIPAPVIDRMILRNPALRRMEIAAGLYGAQQQAVQSVGVRNVLVSHVRVDEEAIYRVVALINEHLPSLRTRQQQMGSVRRLRTDDVDLMAVPVHEGTLQALRAGDRR